MTLEYSLRGGNVLSSVNHLTRFLGSAPYEISRRNDVIHCLRGWEGLSLHIIEIKILVQREVILNHLKDSAENVSFSEDSPTS